MLQALFSLLTNGFLFFALHLSRGNSFPSPLGTQEERRCLDLLAKGDTLAREKLISHNLRLVAHIIKKYYATATDQDDLISIGSIGLIKAVDSFKPEKGARLATYAARCIENEILMHFRAQKKSAQDVSLEDPIETDGEGNPLTLMDILCAEDTLEDEVIMNIESERLRKVIAQIKNRREREILIRRYGLDGSEPMTQKEIAAGMGISRSYVSRIESKALESVKAVMGGD
ncbi:MAG: RNA polymerase sporulation sigma factor SigK [Oscillospiraceae bacterium]|jgi:RNA polymerase sporulation-specific sigma factor|nr:RNA polymerase sporulation sigma factor SigK [Oscillospiraceae bacterium]